MKLEYRVISPLGRLKSLATVFLPLAVALFTSGCVMFPASHLVYEPSSPEGQVINPSGEYVVGNNVLLLIETADYALEIISIPDSPQERLKVYLRLIPRNGSIAVNFDKLTAVSQGATMKPFSARQSSNGKAGMNFPLINQEMHLNPSTRAYYEIEFPITQESANEFEFMIGEGAFLMGEQPVKIAPVKFKKARKFGLYNGSLNY